MLLGLSYLVAMIALIPLFPWWNQLEKRVDEFSDLGPNSTNPLVSFLNLQLFTMNVAKAGRWALDYFRPPLMLAVCVGGLFAVLLRDRFALFMVLLLVIPTFFLLDRGTILFSRYFMFAIYPAYVLAAFGIAHLGRFVGHIAASSKRDWLHNATGSTVSMTALAVLVVIWLPFTTAILLSPDEAPLSAEDHFQYVEQWYALTGLSQMADLIRSSAEGSGSATVLEPKRAWWYASRMPEDALRFYLWDQPRVQFVEVDALGGAENLCALRPWASPSEPVFVVVDGTDTLGGGAESTVPARIQNLETALARDVPEAMEVLRIPRPNAPNWLSVIRINARPAAPDAACPR
jgi:hypothetical protein